jgi:hypothetical protein
VACSRLGIQAVLVDEDPLSRFKTAAHRWVHPYLIEWPIGDPLLNHLSSIEPALSKRLGQLWFRRTTDFPAMNWRSGSAESVSRRLKLLLEAEISSSTAVRIDLREWKAGSIASDSVGTPTIKRNGQREVVDGLDAVVLATGFGVESSKPNYWAPDELDLVRSNEIVRVWGTGDGGVTDILRASIRSFSYEEIIPFIDSLDQKFVDWAIEAERPQHRGSLADLYMKMPIDESLSKWMGERRISKDDAHLPILVHDDRGAFVTNCSPLNRFLLKHAVELNILRISGGSGIIRSKLSETGRILTGKEPGHQIERRGASRDKLPGALPEFDKAVAKLESKMKTGYQTLDSGAFGAQFDVLRWPIYPRDAFGQRDDERAFDLALGPVFT